MLNKKIIIVAMCMLISFSTWYIPALGESNNNDSKYIQQIFNDVQALVPSVNLSDAEIVPLSSSALAYSGDSQEMGIRLVTEENGMIKSEFLIPSRIDENGNLINSFSTRGVSDMGQDLDFSFVNIVVYISCYYQLSFDNLVWVYRPTGFTTRWTSNVSSTSVSNIDIMYKTVASRVYFDTAEQFGSYPYTWIIRKDFSYPEKDQVYAHWNFLPAPYGFICLNSNDGAVCSFTITYNSNNQNFSQSANQAVFPHI